VRAIKETRLEDFDWGQGTKSNYWGHIRVTIGDIYE